MPPSRLPPSDKTDDPNCGTRRYKYIVLRGWPDMEAKKTLSFLSMLRFFGFCFFLYIYFFFSAIWKARHGLQKSSPVFIFGSAVFWGMLRPSWTPFCGCHYFHTVSVHTHTHTQKWGLAEGIEWDIYSVFLNPYRWTRRGVYSKLL